MTLRELCQDTWVTASYWHVGDPRVESLMASLFLWWCLRISHSNLANISLVAISDILLWFVREHNGKHGATCVGVIRHGLLVWIGYGHQGRLFESLVCGGPEDRVIMTIRQVCTTIVRLQKCLPAATQYILGDVDKWNTRNQYRIAHLMRKLTQVLLL